jgi:hypothetical protein
LIRKKGVKCKTNHGENEKKGEFGNPWNESKCGTPIMLRLVTLKKLVQ